MSEFKKVDSDWKERAAQERERLKKKIEKQGGHENRLPPASLMTIVSTFATQAMIALGEAELPEAGGRRVDIESARFAVDSLAVLRAKTEGNLDPNEKAALDDVIQSLQFRYVKKTKEKASPAGADPKPQGG